MKDNQKKIFCSLEGIDLNKVLMRFIEFPQKNLTYKKVWKFYWNTRFFNRFEYQFFNNAENRMVALYSDLYFREDHLNIFTNFVGEFPYIDYVIPMKKDDKFDLKRGIKMIIRDVSLWKYVKSLPFALRNRIWILMRLGLIVRYEQEMLTLIGNKTYKYVLVYNDSCPYENLIVQRMKKLGIRTGTLQHGLFNLKGNWKGIEYRASVADDFLAWNKLTEETAREAGLNTVKVLGIPRYIKQTPIEHKNSKLFCVILSERGAFEQNCELLKIAKRLSEELQINYYVRLHPTDQLDNYTFLLHPQFHVYSEIKESVQEMCQRADFCLVGVGTSMVIDLIFLNQKFYEYNVNSQPYRDNTFDSYDSLMQIFGQNDSHGENAMFEYYCTTHAVKDKYDAFFKSILQDM